MAILLRFPRGMTKPPVGAVLDPEHPFMRSHLMTVPFNEVYIPDGLELPANNVALPHIFTSGAATPRTAQWTGDAGASWGSNREGSGWYSKEFSTKRSAINLGNSGFLPTDGATVCVIRQLIDTHSTSGYLYDFSNTAGQYARVHAPYSDGNTYYRWGTGTERNLGAVSYNARVPDKIIVRCGSLGMSYWLNGVKIDSSSTPVSRSLSPSSTLFLNDESGGTNTVPQEGIWNFFHVVGEQWSDDMCRWWSAEPYAHMYALQARRLYFFPPLGPGATPPGDGFTIDGTPRDILQHWSISEQLNERGTMRFGVKSMDASYRPLIRERINFTWAGQHFFAGHIHHTEEGALARIPYGVVPIETQCGATDLNALLDRRQIAITLPAGTLKSQLELIEPYLATFGTVLDPAQVNGPTMPELVFTLGSLKALTDKLSIASGYASNINYNNVWSMFAPGTEPAPFNIEDNDARVVGDVRVSPTTVNYGNHITVKFTVPAEPAFVYFLMDAIPTDGETFKVAGQTFTFKDTPVDPNDVQIQGTVDATLDEVVGAIDPLDEVTAFNQGGGRVDVYAAESGAAGNSIQVETTCVDSHWGVEGAAIASHLYHGKDASLTGIAIAEDVPAQEGGANLYELVFEEPTAESQETADALAAGYLVRSLVQPREIRYRTRLHGLHPGMQQQIQVTGRNVDGPCLITAVDISPEGSAKYSYDVTAVEGLIIVPSYQDGWRTLAGRVA